MRGDVPKKALKGGLEPVRVKGGGNCLFRSISKIITGSEDDHLLFRLATVKQGCLNEQQYRKSVQVGHKNIHYTYMYRILFVYFYSFKLVPG